MTPEDQLDAFFADAAPPARDLAFQAAVAERIARRRAMATVLAMIPWTIAAIALCWALGPILAPVAEMLGRTLAPAAAILALTGLGLALSLAAERRLRPI